MNKILLGLLGLALSSTASAHTGMSQYSLLHFVLHAFAAVGVYLAMMAGGFYLLKKLPKAIRIRIKKK